MGCRRNALTEIKNTTAPGASVAAGAEQSSIKHSDSIIDPYDSVNEDSVNMTDDAFDRYRRSMWYMDSDYLRTVTMSQLYDTVYASKPPIIDGLLYPGTYILAGAPKLGKSFLVVQIAYHISTGQPLWGFNVRKGSVLYLALEDDYRRLQKRLYRMFGVDASANLHMSTEAQTLNSGLADQLEGFVRDHPDTKMIIIDTLQKVRGGAGDKCSYSTDYQDIARLKMLTDKMGICLIIVHHTRKQQADDKFDMISGTNGLLGAADGGLLLSKEKRTSSAAILDIAGRDQQDQRLRLVRDHEKLSWQLEKAETELYKEPPDPLIETVAKLVSAKKPKWRGTATALANELGLEMKPNTLTMRLNVTADRLFSEHGILYKNSRSHAGRQITLDYTLPPA